LGIAVENNVNYIAMEYIEKGSLKKFLLSEGDNLSFNDLFNLIVDTCKGMYHLEKNNFLHRDLAARNLLVFRLNNKWSVKISDFGMANQLTTDNISASTDNNKDLPARWTAPEVLKENLYYKESDCWSFGVTCWEILSKGKVPYFNLSDNDAVVEEVLKGTKLEIPVGCPEALWEIILKCFDERATRPSFKILLELFVNYSSLNSDVTLNVDDSEYPYELPPPSVHLYRGSATVEAYELSPFKRENTSNGYQSAELATNNLESAINNPEYHTVEPPDNLEYSKV